MAAHHTPSAASADRLLRDLQSKEALSCDMTRRIYEHGRQTWQTYTPRHWHPCTSFTHTCSAACCTFENVRMDYYVHRMWGASEDDDVLWHICVHIQGSDGDLLVCGGEEPNHDLRRKRKTRQHHNIVTGQCNDMYICTGTSRVHVCNLAVCKASSVVENYTGGVGQAIPTCRITGLIHGGPAMVDKYWRPASVAAASGSSELSARENLSGRSALRRHGNQTSPVYGLSWTSIMDQISTTKNVDIDNASKVRAFLQCRPHRDNYNDAVNEYRVRAYLQICCLFSSEHVAADERDAVRTCSQLHTDITKHVRVSAYPITWPEIRLMQLALNRKRSCTPRIILSPEQRHAFVMAYVDRCLKFWCVICKETCPPASTPSERARQFIFTDFVVAAMYIFAGGIVLPPTVTGSYEEQVIQPDDVLRLTLPSLASMPEYVRDNTSADDHVVIIKRYIIEAVRDYKVNPLVISQFEEGLADMSIDILPETRRNRTKV